MYSSSIFLIQVGWPMIDGARLRHGWTWMALGGLLSVVKENLLHCISRNPPTKSAYTPLSFWTKPDGVLINYWSAKTQCCLIDIHIFSLGPTSIDCSRCPDICIEFKLIYQQARVGTKINVVTLCHFLITLFELIWNEIVDLIWSQIYWVTGGILNKFILSVRVCVCVGL